MLPDDTRSEEKQRTNKPGCRLGNHGIGISYDVEVASLVSERRTVRRGGPVMSLEREVGSFTTDNLWMSIICMYENVSRPPVSILSLVLGSRDAIENVRHL